MTWNKFDAKMTQIYGATVQNLVGWATWRPSCVHPCVWMFCFCMLIMCHGYCNNLRCGGCQNYSKRGGEEKIHDSSPGRPTSGQSCVFGVVPALLWKTSVRAVGIRVEIRWRERQEGANHFTATAAWLRRSLHKRTLHYVITPHCKASRPLPDVIGSSYGTLWSRSVPVARSQMWRVLNMADWRSQMSEWMRSNRFSDWRSDCLSDWWTIWRLLVGKGDSGWQHGRQVFKRLTAGVTVTKYILTGLTSVYFPRNRGFSLTARCLCETV